MFFPLAPFDLFSLVVEGIPLRPTVEGSWIWVPPPTLFLGKVGMATPVEEMSLMIRSRNWLESTTCFCCVDTRLAMYLP